MNGNTLNNFSYENMYKLENSEFSFENSQMYKSECFTVGSSLICKDKNDFRYNVKAAFLTQNKFSVRFIHDTHSSKQYLYCHYGKNKKRVPAALPKRKCPFKMTWKSVSASFGSEEFICTNIFPYHNHPPLSDGDVQKKMSQINSSDVLENLVLDLLGRGTSATEIYEITKSKKDIAGCSFNVLNQLIAKDERLEGNAPDFFRSFIENRLIENDTIISDDPVEKRIFITTRQCIEIWNGLKDVLLIDTLHQFHDYFKCAIMMVTIDSHGCPKLIALAFTKIKSEENYDWIFNEFKIKSLVSPQVIILDPDYGNAVQRGFKDASTYFSLRNVKSRIQACLGNSNPLKSAFKAKFSELFNAENERIFEEKCVDLINEYPLLSESNEFIYLFAQKEKWVGYEIDKVFTADINSEKQCKILNLNVKKVMWEIKSNINMKIFSAFNAISTKKEEVAIGKFIYPLELTGTVLYILRAIAMPETLYSSYCISHILSSLKDSEFCQIHSKLCNDIIEIEDRSHKEPKIFKVNYEYVLCSCMKVFKYGILCPHLIYACILNQFPLNEFIIMNTSRRWLLPHNLSISIDEVIQKCKSVQIRENVKFKKRRKITGYHKNKKS